MIAQNIFMLSVIDRGNGLSYFASQGSGNAFNLSLTFPPHSVEGNSINYQLSLNKMLGSLNDAGNTSTLAGYINLLDESGLLIGLQKFSIDKARRRASAPKFQVYNNALKTAFSPLTFEQAILDRSAWGHIFECKPSVNPVFAG